MLRFVKGLAQKLSDELASDYGEPQTLPSPAVAEPQKQAAAEPQQDGLDVWDRSALALSRVSSACVDSMHRLTASARAQLGQVPKATPVDLEASSPPPVPPLVWRDGALLP